MSYEDNPFEDLARASALEGRTVCCSSEFRRRPPKNTLYRLVQLASLDHVHHPSRAVRLGLCCVPVLSLSDGTADLVFIRQTLAETDQLARRLSDPLVALHVLGGGAP